MKKIITLLIVVITALYFHSRTSKVAENGDLFEIRRALSGEQFGPFDTSEKLYIIVGIDYIPFELIELFREITGIKVVVDIFDSNEILDMVLDEIVQELARGNDVKLSSFGTFSLRDKKARSGRNPKTGVEAVITSRRVISFKPSQTMRKTINA